MARFAGRGLDKFWFGFFVMHIPISILLDLQSLYPPSLLAKTPFPGFMEWYLAWSRDPILIGAASDDPSWGWLRCFMRMEGGFQLPIFFIGAWCLWKNDKRVYPLLLAYGASTATTIIPTLNALFTIQSTPPLTTGELANLLGSYVPFLLIPLGIAIDMGSRLVRIVAQAEERKTI